jgi:hypothetical protein
LAKSPEKHDTYTSVAITLHSGKAMEITGKKRFVCCAACHIAHQQAGKGDQRTDDETKLQTRQRVEEKTHNWHAGKERKKPICV